MNEINNIFQEFLFYFKRPPINSYSIVLLLSFLLLFYIFPTVFFKLYNKNDINIVFRRRFSKILSYLFLIIILLTLTLYNIIKKNIILENNLQALILILFIILFISVIYLVKKLINSIKNKDVELLSIQNGPISLNSKVSSLKKLVRSLNFYVLLTLLPYLFLFLGKDIYTYGIIIDNSPSMSNKLDELQFQLLKIAKMLPADSKFVITTIPICNPQIEDCSKFNPKTNINDIISIKDINELSPVSEVFQSKRELLLYLENTKFESSNIGSPLLESIWQNYNVSKADGSNPIRLLMFTDGEDNLYSNSVGFKKPNSCIFETINQNSNELNIGYDKVSIVHFNGFGGERFYDNCSNIQILEGNDTNSLISNTKLFFNDVITDWYFIYILLILHFILLLIFFIIGYENR